MSLENSACAVEGLFPACAGSVVTTSVRGWVSRSGLLDPSSPSFSLAALTALAGGELDRRRLAGGPASLSSEDDLDLQQQGHYFDNKTVPDSYLFLLGVWTSGIS